jgi:hypothetical protein
MLGDGLGSPSYETYLYHYHNVQVMANSPALRQFAQPPNQPFQAQQAGNQPQ